MIILLGTTSEQKINIIKKNLMEVLDSSFDLIPYKVNSGVSDQPLDLKTTKQGAKNRMLNAIEHHNGIYDYSIGLEGGLVKKDNNTFHLVCVAAIKSFPDRFSFGISDLIPLPKTVSDLVEKGEQFGKVIRDYYKESNFAESEDKIIKELISREASFSQAFIRAWTNLQKGMH